MGVYIKGMTIEQLRRMGVAGIILSEERLVEIKEPHGDLIDRDKHVVLPKTDGKIEVVIEAEGK